jgi:hypothetical protein
MADKEATVFVIDLGASMGKATQGRPLNNLEWSMQYVWDKVLAKVFYILRKSLKERFSQEGRRTWLVLSGFERTVGFIFTRELTVRNGQ